MIQHRLKTWPQYFKDVVDGSKTFEIRVDDRDFQAQDELDLAEYDPEAQTFSGDRCVVVVPYLLRLKAFKDIKGWRWRLARWIMPNVVVMSVYRQEGER